MSIAFLGLGRMGRELASHVVAEYGDVTVWNRTPDKAEPFADLGATVALSRAAAVADADTVLTCLFGPDAVRETILEGDLPFAPGALWIDITTIGPAFAAESAAWAEARGLAYVHSPVLGSLVPARNRDLGVLIGGTDPSARAKTRDIVKLWADPNRVLEYDTAAKAGVGKLVVNYGLAVGVQALAEALRVAQAGGLSLDEGLALTGLAKTPLSVISGMKGAVIRDRSWANSQFTANALAKDVDLMLGLAEGQAVPALTAAFAALEHARRAGHGEDDFTAMVG